MKFREYNPYSIWSCPALLPWQQRWLFSRKKHRWTHDYVRWNEGLGVDLFDTRQAWERRLRNPICLAIHKEQARLKNAYLKTKHYEFISHEWDKVRAKVYRKYPEMKQVVKVAPRDTKELMCFNIEGDVLFFRDVNDARSKTDLPKNDKAFDRINSGRAYKGWMWETRYDYVFPHARRKKPIPSKRV